MGIPVPALVLLLIILVVLYLSSHAGDERNGRGQPGNGKGKGGRGHGNGHGGQGNDPDDPTGNGKGKGRGGRKAQPRQPHGGQPNQPGRRGSTAPAPTYRPPRVVPSFDSPAAREAYIRDLESQGCRVDRNSGMVTMPGEAPQSPVMNGAALIFGLTMMVGLYWRIYGNPLIVLLEFIRIMSER